MTAHGLKRALKRLGVSQLSLARRLGMDPRTVRRWCAADLPVPRTVEIVLSCWRNHGLPAEGRRP
jgi:transcriptional regulator with XRE-family HTH domain